MESQLQTCLEQLSGNPGRMDHTFVAATVNDTMQKTNAEIYSIASCLGQSICIGGVIAFFSENQYIVIPFGGGDICLWSEQKLTHIGDPITNEYITRNPIGCHTSWTGKYWNGTLLPNSRLILSSNPLKYTNEIITALTEGSLPESHDDTVSLLLRQYLEKHSLPPIAVLDFHM